MPSEVAKQAPTMTRANVGMHARNNPNEAIVVSLLLDVPPGMHAPGVRDHSP
jgi:hypothetical protein